MRAIYPLTMSMMPNAHPANVNTRMLFDVLTQEYTADITMMPKRRNFTFAEMMLPPSTHETFALVREGERSTWPKIEQIRNCTSISRKLDAVLTNLDQNFKPYARSVA